MDVELRRLWHALAVVVADVRTRSGEVGDGGTVDGGDTGRDDRL